MQHASGGDCGRALQQGGDEPAVVIGEFGGFAGQKANRPARCRRLRSSAQCRITNSFLWFGRWILPSALCRPIPHNRVLSGKAPVPEFPPKCCSVVATAPPAFVQPGFVRVEDAGATIGMTPCRGMTGPQPTAYRPAFDADRPGDRFQRQTLLAQTGDFSEAGIAAFLGSMAKCGRWGWSAMVSADRLAL